MDTFQADPPENQEFQVALQAENAQLQADGVAMQQQAVQAGLQPAPIVRCTMEEGLERWNNQKRRAHRGQFPLSDHLFTLMTIVQADLILQQRERLTSHLAIRGISVAKLHVFTFFRTAVLELSCLLQDYGE